MIYKEYKKGYNVAIKEFDVKSKKVFIKLVHSLMIIDDEYVSCSGFNSKGVEVFFPINSKLILAMYERTHHSARFKDR